MPIKPENRGRYPADWPEIRARILRRALFRCEHPGCDAPDRAIGYWHEGRFVVRPQALREAGYTIGDAIQCADGASIRLIRIVLTIAHLDHQPENCSDENLRALCQRHHLAHDAPHHAATARATRRARMAAGDLFDMEERR